MQFKQPEIFYALLLLLIPILVHLFQLRRFVKIPFTNVAFLKEIQLKTRKSSQLKKWLVLALRSLALAALVTAFTQPFLTDKDQDDRQDEYVLYLDNSFSMNAKGSQATLLSSAVQSLYDNPPLSGNFSWFTNTQQYESQSAVDFKNSLLEIKPGHKQLKFEEILLKANRLYKNSDQNKKLIVVSDFQQSAFSEADSLGEIQIQAVKMQALSAANVSIDSAYISSNATGNLLLNVSLSANTQTAANYPVSLWNGDALEAKSAVSFKDQTQAEVSFPVNQNTNYLGRISINDQQLAFDNELYFSIGNNEPIKVLSISQQEDEFLTKLFTAPDFQLSQYTYSAADYNAILQQNVVVLNELERIPDGLTTALIRFKDNGGVLVVIPAASIDKTQYNNLLSSLNAGRLGNPVNQARKLTTINFDHPLYKGVFNQVVDNFQYPTFNTFYNLGPAPNAALELEGQAAFLVQSPGVYLFTAPLSESNSNFKESPLIVPTFYNIGRSALPLPVLYYNIGQSQQIGLPASLGADQIVRLSGKNGDFIPLQQSFSNKVVLSTGELPEESGHYFATSTSDTLAILSYNSPREEAENQTISPESLPATVVFDSVDDLIIQLQQEREQRPLWQWFVVLSALFLIAEMAVLRFFK